MASKSEVIHSSYWCSKVAWNTEKFIHDLYKWWWIIKANFSYKKRHGTTCVWVVAVSNVANDIFVDEMSTITVTVTLSRCPKGSRKSKFSRCGKGKKKTNKQRQPVNSELLSVHTQTREKNNLPLLVFWSSCTAAPCPEIRKHVNNQHRICCTYYSPTQIINQRLLPSCCSSSSFTWRSLAAILSCSEFSFCWVTASSAAWAKETGRNWNHVQQDDKSEIQ